MNWKIVTAFFCMFSFPIGGVQAENDGLRLLDLWGIAVEKDSGGQYTVGIKRLYDTRLTLYPDISLRKTKDKWNVRGPKGDFAHYDIITFTRGLVWCEGHNLKPTQKIAKHRLRINPRGKSGVVLHFNSVDIVLKNLHDGVIYVLDNRGFSTWLSEDLEAHGQSSPPIMHVKREHVLNAIKEHGKFGEGFHLRFEVISDCHTIDLRRR